MSTANYLSVSKLYDTGFIPTNAYKLRNKQGLASQAVTNACNSNPDTVQADGKPNVTPCNRNAMYPMPQSILSYGIPSIPKGCPCLYYVKAP